VISGIISILSFVFIVLFLAWGIDRLRQRVSVLERKIKEIFPDLN